MLTGQVEQNGLAKYVGEYWLLRYIDMYVGKYLFLKYFDKYVSESLAFE